MASKRRLRRKSCTGKVRYPDRATAAGAIKHLQYKRGVIHSYYCDFCGFWHIGHARTRQRAKFKGAIFHP